MPRPAAQSLVRAVLALSCLGGASHAQGLTGRQGLAVMPFTGKGAGRVEKAVVGQLGARPDVRLVLPQRWRGEMRRHPQRKDAVEPDNFAAGAWDLNLRAVVSGQILDLAGKRQLVVDVLDAGGAVISELAYPLAAPPGAAQAAAAQHRSEPHDDDTGDIPDEVLARLSVDLADAVDSAIGVRPRPRSPAVVPLADLDRPDPEADKAAVAEIPRVPPPAPRPAARAPVISFAIGPLLAGRRLSFSDPGHPSLTLDTGGGISAEAAVQPFPAGPLHGLLAFASAGLVFAPDLTSTAGDHFARDERRFEGGVGYRLLLSRPRSEPGQLPGPGIELTLSLAYGDHRLSVADPLTLPPNLDPVPPTVDYKYLAPQLGARLPLRLTSAVQFDLHGELAYRGLLSAGDIASPQQYGALTAGSGAVHARLGVSCWRRLFFATLAGQADDYFLSFDPTASASAAKHTATATDLYLTAMLLLGVSR